MPKTESKPLLMVISAPSGAGKTTVCEGLIKRNKNIRRAVTCTTREPRKGEKNGRDYYFFSAGEFLKRVQSGHFLEHATVYGNSYGTLKSEVRDHLRAGHDVLLAIDVQGAAEVSRQAKLDPELAKSLVEIFILPPSLDELKDRLTKRDSDTPAAMRKRLKEARNEIRQWKHYDYVVVSETRKRDLDRVAAIYEAERMKRARVTLPKSLNRICK